MKLSLRSLLLLALLALTASPALASDCAPSEPAQALQGTLELAVQGIELHPPPAPTKDTDGDGVTDDKDTFPYDYRDSKDSDGDGVGDKADAFPQDPKESRDSDCDGKGDNSDKKFDGKGVCSHVDYSWKDGKYGFRSRFDLTTNPDGTMTATVRIQLDGERDAKREQEWEQVTEKTLSQNGLKVDVVFQSDAAGSHSKVKVAKGNGRSNASQLYTSDEPMVVAHEIGHHLGLPDEYADPGDPDRFIGPQDSIMRSTQAKAKAYKRHIDAIKSLFKCP